MRATRLDDPSRPSWRRALGAGALYFAMVFVAGFVLGTIRTIALTPTFGEATAVLIELPFMLAISWIACGVALRRFRMKRGGGRAVMGAFAFALLIAAEAALAVFLMGRTVAGFLSSFATLPGALGLAGQILFASFPLIRK